MGVGRIPSGDRKLKKSMEESQSLEQCAEPRKTELAVGLREDRTQ